MAANDDSDRATFYAGRQFKVTWRWTIRVRRYRAQLAAS
jgi:hypothetical protein